MTENEKAISWSQAWKLSLKLILYDVLWSIPITIICLVIVAQRQLIPSDEWCQLLDTTKQQAALKFPILAILLELFSLIIFYSTPILTCLLLLEESPSGKWFVAVKSVLKRWKKLFTLVIVLVGIRFGYRVFVYIFFVRERDKSSYPSWFLFPAEVYWVFSMTYIVNIASKHWTAINASNLVMNHRLPQERVLKEAKRIRLAIRKKVLLSLFLPSITGFVFQHLTLKMIDITQDTGRGVIIVTTLSIGHILWFWIDREGKLALPWSHDIRLSLTQSTLARAHKAVSGSRSAEMNLKKQWTDPIEKNGFALSIFVIAALTVGVRVLQANMSTLWRKIVVGLMASSLESIFVVLKPYILDQFLRIRMLCRSRLARVYPQHNLTPVVAINKEDSSKHQASHSEVYKWHRSHTIVLVNRIELLSIMLGNGIVILTKLAHHFGMKDKAVSVSSTDEHSQICQDYSNGELYQHNSQQKIIFIF